MASSEPVAEHDGEQTDDAVERSARHRYVRQRWRVDARLTRIAAVVALLLHPVGSLTDVAIIGEDPRLVPLIAFRVLASVIHIPILLACARDKPPPWIERLIAAAFFMTVLAGVYMPTALRPTSVASQGGPLLLLIVLHALVFPAWRAYKITCFMIASAVYLAIGAYWHSKIGYGGPHELITITIFLVAIGTLIPKVSRRIEQTEFDRFVAQDELTRTVVQLRQEVELREERERALEHARQRAEHANKAKTSFMASVSHELRTPLVGILGVTELLHETNAPLGPETRRRVELLRQSGDYLLGLVNDLLDYFKLEAGKLEMHEEPVELRGLTSTAVELLKPRAAEHGIELRLDVDSTLPEWIVGDPQRIQQIVLNLLGNSVKFTEHGHVALRVVRDPDHHDRQLLLEVQDTGLGMEESFIERMFDPFEQSGGSSRRGTGLGLTITRRFVEQMNGELEVESQLGQGTTIRVHMPLRATEPPRSKSTPIGAGGAPRALRVLVGEDNRVNAMVIVAMLQRLGHEVTVAHDGSELVEHATRERFDIVLTDINMPVMDGVHATAEIRALPAPQCEVPVLALTADAFEDRHVELRNAGLDDVLVKPISSPALALALERHTRSDPR